MKATLTLHVLIALLLVSAGLAWASAGEVTELAPAAPSQVEQPQQVEPPQQADDQTKADDEQGLSVEDPLAMDPGKVNTGGGDCCLAGCQEERVACEATCSPTDLDCPWRCYTRFVACKNNC